MTTYKRLTINVAEDVYEELDRLAGEQGGSTATPSCSSARATRSHRSSWTRRASDRPNHAQGR